MIGVYYTETNERSKIVGEAMFRGIRQDTLQVELIKSRMFRPPARCKAAIFYGLSDGLRAIFEHYRAEGKPVIFIDLGYWNRKKRTRFDGFHKLVLNSRHPTEYFQNTRHPADRFKALGVPILPWRKKGRHIIVAGMSAKGAAAEGLAAEQWERNAVAELRKHTDRPIIYRPKPNWIGPRPIFGTTMQRDVPLEHALRDAHAVVTHHSNVAVDAILAGIPAICPYGVAACMSVPDFSMIEDLAMPDGREQWAADIAYTQYSVQEMQNGVAYLYLKREGLL